jgi:SAM-dependent methyltransferase
MSWDATWERAFATRKRWGSYPPEELVRFVARHFYDVPDRAAVRFLELGCGPGAGPSWYLAREGFRYSGIDASPTAVERSRQRFATEHLNGEFVCQDFSCLPWAVETFDAVIDVASLQCNDEHATASIIDEIHRVLRPGGRHFSLTARVGSWGDGTGQKIDRTTWTDVQEGPYVGLGPTRFADEAGLRRLYHHFRDLTLDYSIRSEAGGAYEVGHWVLSCIK